MAVVGHFAVYDRKAGQYFPVFSARNSEVARRMIVQSFNKESMLVWYPSDYFLAHLCDFDDESGDIFTVVIDDAENSVPARECSVEIRDLIPESLRQYALDGSFAKK